MPLSGPDRSTRMVIGRNEAWAWLSSLAIQFEGFEKRIRWGPVKCENTCRNLDQGHYPFTEKSHFFH